MVRTGVGAGDRFTTGGRWPLAKIRSGEHMRFHMLTDGNDTWFLPSMFHRFGEGMQTREVICVASMSDGEEECRFCNEGHTNRVNRFALWVWVHFYLHTSDNPDLADPDKKAKAEPWPMVTVDERRMFKEVVEKPLLLRLSAGRYQNVFKQFSGAFTQYGNLREHMYNLSRLGEGLETQYTLKAGSEKDPLSEEILNKDEVKELPSIEDVFRDTTNMGPATSAGSNSSDGVEAVSGDDEPMPQADVPTAEAEPADESLI